MAVPGVARGENSARPQGSPSSGGHNESVEQTAEASRPSLPDPNLPEPVRVQTAPSSSPPPINVGVEGKESAKETDAANSGVQKPSLLSPLDRVAGRDLVCLSEEDIGRYRTEIAKPAVYSDCRHAYEYLLNGKTVRLYTPLPIACYREAETVLVNALLTQKQAAGRFGAGGGDFSGLQLVHDGPGYQMSSGCDRFNMDGYLSDSAYLARHKAGMDGKVAYFAGQIFHEVLHDPDGDIRSKGDLYYRQPLPGRSEIPAITGQLGFYLLERFMGPYPYDSSNCGRAEAALLRNEIPGPYDRAAWIAAELVERRLREQFPDISRDVQAATALDRCKGIAARVPLSRDAELLRCFKAAIIDALQAEKVEEVLADFKRTKGQGAEATPQRKGVVLRADGQASAGAGIEPSTVRTPAVDLKDFVTRRVPERQAAVAALLSEIQAGRTAAVEGALRAAGLYLTRSPETGVPLARGFELPASVSALCSGLPGEQEKALELRRAVYQQRARQHHEQLAGLREQLGVSSPARSAAAAYFMQQLDSADRQLTPQAKVAADFRLVSKPESCHIEIEVANGLANRTAVAGFFGEGTGSPVPIVMVPQSVPAGESLEIIRAHERAHVETSLVWGKPREALTVQQAVVDELISCVAEYKVQRQQQPGAAFPAAEVERRLTDAYYPHYTERARATAAELTQLAAETADPEARRAYEAAAAAIEQDAGAQYDRSGRLRDRAALAAVVAEVSRMLEAGEPCEKVMQRLREKPRLDSFVQQARANVRPAAEAQREKAKPPPEGRTVAEEAPGLRRRLARAEIPTPKSNLGKVYSAGAMMTVVQAFTHGTLKEQAWHEAFPNIPFTPLNVGRVLGLPEDLLRYQTSAMGKPLTLGLEAAKTTGELYMFSAMDHLATRGLAAGLQRMGAEKTSAWLVKHGLGKVAGPLFAFHAGASAYNGIDFLHASKSELNGRGAGAVVQGALAGGALGGPLGAGIGATIATGTAAGRALYEAHRIRLDGEENIRLQAVSRTMDRATAGLLKSDALPDNEVTADVESWTRRRGNALFLAQLRESGIARSEVTTLDEAEKIRRDLNSISELEETNQRLAEENAEAAQGLNFWNPLHFGRRRTIGLNLREIGYNNDKISAHCNYIEHTLGLKTSSLDFRRALTPGQIEKLQSMDRAGRTAENQLTALYRRAVVVEYHGEGAKPLVKRDELAEMNAAFKALGGDESRAAFITTHLPLLNEMIAHLDPSYQNASGPVQVQAPDIFAFAAARQREEAEARTTAREQFNAAMLAALPAEGRQEWQDYVDGKRKLSAERWRILTGLAAGARPKQ